MCIERERGSERGENVISFNYGSQHTIIAGDLGNIIFIM